MTIVVDHSFAFYVFNLSRGLGEAPSMPRLSRLVGGGRQIQSVVVAYIDYAKAFDTILTSSSYLSSLRTVLLVTCTIGLVVFYTTVHSKQE